MISQNLLAEQNENRPALLEEATPKINETRSSTAVIISQTPAVSQKKEIFYAAFSLINAALYFFVASAGVNNIKKLFDLTDSDATKNLLGVGVGASLCYGMFSYKMIENLTLKPTAPLSIVMTSLAPFAASTFMTAGIEGSKTIDDNWFDVPTSVGIGIGIALFALRTLAYVDGAVKFPAKMQELKNNFVAAIQNRDVKEASRLIVAVYTALGFSLASTDATYAAANKISLWAGTDADSNLTQIISYISAGLGAVGLLPTTFYWTLRGIRQATFGGKVDMNNVTADPTNRHTIIGAIGTLPVALGVLGSVTSTEGAVFSKLGKFSTAIRVSSSLIFSVAGGLPGLSTLSRNITNRFFSSSSNSASSNSTNATNDHNHYISLNTELEEDSTNSSWCCWKRKR
jgi:hypothetical protein